MYKGETKKLITHYNIPSEKGSKGPLAARQRWLNTDVPIAGLAWRNNVGIPRVDLMLF